MRKFVLVLSKIVLILAVLNVFAWSIQYVYKGGKRFGVFTNVIKEFAEFPTTVYTVLGEIEKPERLIAADPDFKEINHLSYDLFAVSSIYKQSQWVISLTNLKNDSLIFDWTLNEKDFNSSDRTFAHSEPILPIILKDTSLILHNNESNNLYRLNSNSKVVWKNSDFQFHHAIQLDHSGAIWACTREIVTSPDNNLGYWDDGIAKLDAETGETMFHKSLTQIFLDNHLSFLIHGYANDIVYHGEDPFHLNEIEPVLKDGPFWNKGDLFISLRHRSMILHYRPSSNKIIRLIQGEFYNQHDIDIISDSVISIFNNNVSSLYNYGDTTGKGALKSLEFLPNQRLNQTSEVVLYDLSNSTFSSLYVDQFKENNIFTRTQGLHRMLANGDLFVEEWEEGKVFIFNENELVLSKYFNKPENGLLEYTHWIRLYENLDFLK